MSSTYDEVIREYFRSLISKHRLGDEQVTARASVSSSASGAVEFKVIPPEWFRLPSREYAIARGREVIMECVFRGARAHVFTSSPLSGSLKLSDVIELELKSISERSVFYGCLNAVMRYLGLTDRTVHCRGEEPVRCAEELAGFILSEYGGVSVLLIGYQPAMARALARKLRKFFITDMNPENVGKEVSGVRILDHLRNFELMEVVELVLVTGSSLINSTLWAIYDRAKELGRDLIVYGVSAAGAAEIMNIKRYCRFGA